MKSFTASFRLMVGVLITIVLMGLSGGIAQIGVAQAHGAVLTDVASNMVKADPKKPKPKPNPSTSATDDPDDPDKPSDDEEEKPKDDKPKGDGEDYSFYNIAAAATSFYDAAADPLGNAIPDEGGEKGDAKPKGTDMWQPSYQGNKALNMQTAGMFVGFDDKDLTGTSRGISCQNSTGISCTRSYSAFKGAGSANNKFFRGYMEYGHALAKFGFDKTDVGNQKAGNLNSIIGNTLYGMYALANVVDGLFVLLIKMLQAINPFAFFFVPTATGNTHFYNIFNSMFGTVPGVGVVFSGLAQFLSGLYGAASTFGLFFIVLMGVTMLLFVMMKSTNTASRAKGGQETVGTVFQRFFVRLAFIAIGVPFLGGVYTAALDTVESWSVDTPNGGTRIIASTFVDFQSWVEHNALNLPDNVLFNIDTGGNMDTSVNAGTPRLLGGRTLRDVAFKINLDSNGDLGSAFARAPGGDDKELNVKDFWGNRKGGGSDNFVAQFRTTADMLSRYANGNTYSASDYETVVKSAFSGSSKQSTPAAFFGGAEFLTDAKNFVPETKGGDAPAFKGDCKKKDDGPADPDKKEKPCNPTMITIASGSGLTSQGVTVGAGEASGAPSICKGGGSNYVCQKSSVGLSRISMFNYLASEFTDSSVTTYSTKKAAGAGLGRQHFSVNAIGSGPDSFLYQLNAMAMLFSIIIISIFYSLGMFINIISRTFKLIIAIPLSSLGALKIMAKVVMYTIMMIMELLVTYALYRVVVELLVGVSQIVEVPMQILFSGGSKQDAISKIDSVTASSYMDGWHGAMHFEPATVFALLPMDNDGERFKWVSDQFSSGTGVSIFAMMVSIVIYLWFSLKAIKSRTVLLRGLDEGLGRIIDKVFLSGNVAASTGGGATPSQKAVRTAGAVGGTVAAGAIMSGVMGGGASTAASNGALAGTISAFGQHFMGGADSPDGSSVNDVTAGDGGDAFSSGGGSFGDTSGTDAGSANATSIGGDNVNASIGTNEPGGSARVAKFGEQVSKSDSLANAPSVAPKIAPLAGVAAATTVAAMANPMLAPAAGTMNLANMAAGAMKDGSPIGQFAQAVGGEIATQHGGSGGAQPSGGAQGESIIDKAAHGVGGAAATIEHMGDAMANGATPTKAATQALGEATSRLVPQERQEQLVDKAADFANRVQEGFKDGYNGSSGATNMVSNPANIVNAAMQSRGGDSYTNNGFDANAMLQQFTEQLGIEIPQEANANNPVLRQVAKADNPIKPAPKRALRR